MISSSGSELQNSAEFEHHVVRHLSKTDAVRRQGACHLRRNASNKTQLCAGW